MPDNIPDRPLRFHPDGSIQEVDVFEAAVLNPSVDRTAEANP